LIAIMAAPRPSPAFHPTPSAGFALRAARRPAGR